jgi:hypothetical protein
LAIVIDQRTPNDLFDAAFVLVHSQLINKQGRLAQSLPAEIDRIICLERMPTVQN